MAKNTHHQKKPPHFIGPIGGAITKNLVELGEKELMNSNKKKR
ncbi:MAG: hypothetical protein RR585_03060 [Coprobacillus sp.]